jgi:hypothetical protein
VGGGGLSVGNAVADAADGLNGVGFSEFASKACEGDLDGFRERIGVLVLSMSAA